MQGLQVRAEFDEWGLVNVGQRKAAACLGHVSTDTDTSFCRRFIRGTPAGDAGTVAGGGEVIVTVGVCVRRIRGHGMGGKGG